MCICGIWSQAKNLTRRQRRGRRIIIIITIIIIIIFIVWVIYAGYHGSVVFPCPGVTLQARPGRDSPLVPADSLVMIRIIELVGGVRRTRLRLVIGPGDCRYYKVSLYNP